MRPTLVTLSICVLLLLSVVAIYKACESKPSIDDDDDAVTAKLAERAAAPYTESQAESMPPASRPTKPMKDENPAAPVDTNADVAGFSDSGDRILILSYRPVGGSSLAYVLTKSEFAIEVKVTKDLLVNGSMLRSGEYLLRVKNIDGGWELLVVGDGKNYATIPLRFERGLYHSDRLMVDIDEYASRATISIRLGREQLSGSFEIR